MNYPCIPTIELAGRFSASPPEMSIVAFSNADSRLRERIEQAQLTRAHEMRLFINVRWRNTWEKPQEDWHTPFLNLRTASDASWQEPAKGLARWVQEVPVIALLGESYALVLGDKSNPPMGTLHLDLTLPCTGGDASKALPRGADVWFLYNVWIADVSHVSPADLSQPYKSRSLTPSGNPRPGTRDPSGVRRVLAEIRCGCTEDSA